MMKKKLAMLLALVMTVTSIESSALAVRGADFGSEPVQIAEEAEPQAAAEEASAESFGAEASEESFSDEFTAEESPEIEAEAEGAEEIFGSEETESIPEIGEEEKEPQDASGEEIFQTEESFAGEEAPQEEAVFGDEVQAVEEDFAAEVGSVIPQEGVTPLKLSVDYPANIDTPGKKEWFSFTPTETGKYSFSSNSEDSNVDAQAYLYNGQGVELSSDDQSKGSNNDFLLTYMLEAGQTYYYCAKSYFEDRTGFFTVRLEKQRSIEAVKVDNIAPDVVEGFGNLYESISNASFTITYTDGTEPYVYANNGSGNSFVNDPYGNSIYIECLTADGESTNYYNLKAGAYQLQLKWEESVLGTYPVQVIPVEESSHYGGELQDGENQINTYDETNGWNRIFKYIPSETAEYAFVGAGGILEVKTANPAGGLEDVEFNSAKCTMEAGKNYYLSFFSSGEYVVNVTKTVDIQGASLENIAADVPEGFGNLGLAVNNSVITVTYADGTEPYVYTNDGNWSLSFTDPYGNYIYSQYLNEDGSEADMYNLKAGIYQVQLKCEDSDLGTYPIQVVPVEESGWYSGELQDGENQIVTYEDTCKIFKYTPSETAEYAFIGAGDITVKTANPAGELEDVESNGMKCAMEQGKSYYLTFSWGGENMVHVIKAVNVSSVSVDTSEAKTEFLAGLERYSPKGMKLSVSYEDGSSEILTYEYEHDTEVRDSKGNVFSYRIWKDDTEFDQWDNLDAGTYEIRIQCNDEEIPRVSYTVTFGEGENLRLLQKGINSQVESPDGEYAWYRFTPDTDSLYLFNPVYEISVYKKGNGGVLEQLDSYSSGAFRLEANEEYLVGLQGGVFIYNPETDEDDYYNTFDMEIREIPELTGLQANVPQTEGLAGLYYYTGAEILCTYSDGTSETVRWDIDQSSYVDSEKGLELSAVITDEAGTTYSMGDSLAAGTYSLKFQNANNIESNSVEIKIASDIAKTSLLKGEVYEGRNLEMESPLNSYAYYSFTPENDGIYEADGTSHYNSFIRKTKDGYKDMDRKIKLAKGETAYIRLYGGNYDDDAAVCNVKIYSQEKLASIEWSKNTATVNTQLEGTWPSSQIPAVLIMTYEDGTSKNYSVTYNGDCEDIEEGDYKSVDITFTDNKTGESYSIWDFENHAVPNGSYMVTAQYAESKSSPLELTVQDCGVDTLAKLEEGEQTISVGCSGSYFYYVFQPKESGTYGLKTNLKYISLNVKVYSEDGYQTELYDYSTNKGNAALNLEAGQKYVIGLSNGEKEDSQETVTLKKLPEIKELKVNSYSPKKQVYIENIDDPGLSLAEVEVCFEDGTSQVITTGYDSEDSCDLYGRYLEKDLVKQLENGTYEEVEWQVSYPTGEYAYRIVFDEREDKAVYIPVKIVALKDYDATVLSETGKTSIDNQGSRISLQYTAKEAGRYEFRFNVPVSDISIFTEQGARVSEYYIDERHIYANLEKGTYFVCLRAKEKNTALSVEASFLTPKVDGLKATISKNTYIAGYNDDYTSNLLTEVTMGGKTYKVQGYAEINGYLLRYRIENGEEEKGYGESLPVGTWTITPYLVKSPAGGQETVMLEGTSVTIQTVLPDFNALPSLAEDWTEVKNTENGEAYYKFTAPEAGVYTYETKHSQESDWIYAQLYKNKDNQLTVDGYDNSKIKLDKNETCFIVVHSSGNSKIKLTRHPVITNGPIILKDGTDTFVNQTVEEISAEFTPEENGYYSLKLNDMMNYDVEILIGGEFCGIQSCEYLQKGKTYHYKLRLKDYYHMNETYRLTCNKINTKKIKDIRLVLNDSLINNNPTMDIVAYCQKIIIYEDGTTSEPMGVYEDDVYGNEFMFESSSSSLATDKEVVYDAYFEYRMPGEDQWHKTKVQKITMKGLASYAAMELNRSYTGKVNEVANYSFIPSETGEYILSMDGSENERWYANIAYCSGSNYDNGVSNLRTESAGEGAYSVYLEKGMVYQFQVASSRFAKKDITFSLHRAKALKNLELVKAPDRPKCFINGIEMASLTGMQVKATYADNSTEIITYGKTDSCGRRLSFSSLKWLDAEHGRVYAELGGYQVTFDVISGDLEQMQKLQSTTSFKASKGERIPVQYTATENGLHNFEITGGYIVEKYKDKDGYTYLSNGMSRYEMAAALKKGQTYYFYIVAEEDNLSVSVNFGGHRWVKDVNKSIEPTCTTDGKLVEYCENHKDEIRETSIPKLGHDLGEWTTTLEPTCTADGERQRKCKRNGCAYKETEPIKPTGKHRLGAWRTTRAATALATGIQKRSCSGCDYAQTRTIAKLKPTITLNVPQSKTLPMTLKKSFTVKVSGLAKGDSVKSWYSSNKKIVTVTSKGKMSARKTGTVKITVTLRSGKTAWFKVKVQKSAVKTSKITGISKKITLNKGKRYTLKPVLTPVTTLDKVKYSTSNKKVATVNSRGLIVAKGAGRATITVTAGRKKAKIVVTVPKVKTTKITGVKTSLTLKRGKSYRIRAKAYPKNSDEKITYSSSNKKIATVTSKGVIKAVKKGKVTITVKSGRKVIKMKLTVK
nr:Ig-like domain-containing protein [uncultured Blautia sp.]